MDQIVCYYCVNTECVTTVCATTVCATIECATTVCVSATTVYNTTECHLLSGLHFLHTSSVVLPVAGLLPTVKSFLSKYP